MTPDLWRDILDLSLEHLQLVAIAMLFAAVIGLPLGIAATRSRALERVALGFVNIVQTVPSLALFGFLIPIPFLGIGRTTAILALVLYALLPIVRGTVTGIAGVDAAVRESGLAMGMTGAQLLRLVELPLAAPSIVSGIRVATVTTIGTATIAAAIGAGGLGAFIFRGVATVDGTLLLAGAIPAAIMAIVADALLGALAKRLA